ncbi:MAG: ThuA domain-containing protein [Cyclobacteriaceae bacterium]|nr:ThuA domain-containing protein [Cyclobacteriaceae bacterium]
MMRSLFSVVCLILLSGLFNACTNSTKSLRDDSGRIELLFLGHASEHHNSALYMPILASTLSKEGIFFTYTDNPNDLNAENLSKYDGIAIYANHEQITPEQEKALLDFVASGKGFIPIHCASFCFQNSPKYIDLVGGQFLKHGTDTFTTTIIKKDHAIVNGLDEFSTWDETYVHDKLASDITVLMERVEGDHHEPWTWVKESGKGRVFYTAYGHDERTWNNPGFQQLMKEGILWAVGDQVKEKWAAHRKTLPTLVYRDEAGIPNYEKRNPAPKYQDPLSPEESAKLIQVPVGFDLELFASEPDIINPIAMEWDERGRLWVVETVDYPNTVRDDKGAGDDRIKILEDTNGDGKADKVTVFAENLNIPTSMVFSNGGIIISQAPHFLFLKDTDGDDKADVRKILIDGWGTFDTHAGPSNLKYGFDNQIWGVVGYSGFDGTVAGENRKFGQGIYHFKPDVSSFEFMTGTSNNTWGLGFTENNDVFASTANNTHSVFMGIPNKAARGVEGIQLGGSTKIDGHYGMHTITDKVRQVDVFGGFTAAAGHNFYTARNYPTEFWNQVALVCEPTGHVVHMAKIDKSGAGFIEKDGWNLFASADEWVSPVEAKVGPDGAVWVLDWYNFIVQHNPTPTVERGGFAATNGKGNAYENPLRDKSHGRIWRVVSRNAKKVETLSLSKEKPDQLVKALGNDNLLWRMTAQRLLVERGKLDVASNLFNLVTSNKVDEYGNNYAAIHALWTLDGLGALAKDDKAEAIITEALKHPSAGVRKAAIQILSKSQWTEEAVTKSNVLSDRDPNTRLTAILSLVEIAPSEALGQTLYKLSTEESVVSDEWLSKAIYAVAHQHSKGFLTAFMTANPEYTGPKPVSNVSPDAPDFDDSAWKQMDLPRYIDQNVDGIFWFRRTINVPGNMVGKNALLSLGPINDSDVTYVNGVRVGGTERKVNDKRIYTIASSVLKAGKNLIAIRMEDIGGPGGIYGAPEEMFLDVGGNKIPLSGSWKFEMEKSKATVKPNLFADRSIGQLFADNNMDKMPLNEAVVSVNGATVIKVKVIKNEMKYDLKEFSVVAGKPVEIIFENPDFMQHNLVVTQIGALETVGKAADKLASNPKGAEMNYVPEMPEVLFATKLVNPQQTERLIFIAPKKVGDYPFVCTFPGHWSIMNGVMKVVDKPAL